MNINNVTRFCPECGTMIRGRSVYYAIGNLYAHCLRMHSLKKKEVRVSDEDLKQYTEESTIVHRIYNKANAAEKQKQSMLSRRKPEYVVKSNERLILQIGEEKYKTFPVCSICGLVKKTLYMHVKNIHEMKLDEYMRQYPGSILAAEEYLNDLRNRGLGENNPMYGKGVSENSPFAVEFYIKKGYSPEEARTLRDEKIRKIDETRTISTTVEYYMDKFGVDSLTAKEMLKERQATNRVDVIAKRNNITIEEAQEVRDEITKKWVGTLNKKSDEEWADINKKKVGKNISGASIKFFDELVEYCGISKEECHYGEDKEVSICRNEKFTDMQMKKYFLYDFTYRGKMIEFNGDLYHANPIRYSPDDKPFAGMHDLIDRREWTAEQVWNFDAYKNKVATDHGYEMMVVWEYDAKHNLRNSLERCKKYLLGESNV